MSSNPAITPQTAPRDPIALKAVGIFQLRNLTEKLGGLQSENEKMAYSRMNLDEKVNLALHLLQQWDRQNPGGMQAPAPMAAPAPHSNGVAPGMMTSPAMPLMGTVAAMPGQPQMQAPASPPAQAPAFGGFSAPPGGQLGASFSPAPQPNGFHPQPMTQQPMFAPSGGAPQVAAVDPGALAAAQAAASTAPAATESTRKPRTSKNDTAVDSGLGEKVLNAITSMQQQNQASSEAIVSALKEVTSTIDELRKENVKEQLKTLNEAYGGVYNILKLWDARITLQQNSINLSIALSLMLTEQVLGGAPRDQILAAAMGDANQVGAILAQATQGKA